MRGNVVDLSVGVIIGGAFGNIVSSLVDDIFMPIIGVVIGGIDFSNLSITFGNAVIKYGSFIQQIIDFLIIAICIFMFIKIINRLIHLHKEEEMKKEKPKKSDEIILLEEIRDLLKENNKKISKK
ncbi:MAG: large-conductance mechanosensitive channel protein MscL [Clostridium sp.]|nr:large-conductance mechanosensitive channel protein MscL [Clostridium sp.]MCM1443991.1 large-conductance mechanosensitive channel protein MscL [Candidatus Amulumruptor caecigallinarius]